MNFVVKNFRNKMEKLDIIRKHFLQATTLEHLSWQTTRTYWILFQSASFESLALFIRK